MQNIRITSFETLSWGSWACSVPGVWLVQGPSPGNFRRRRCGRLVLASAALSCCWTLSHAILCHFMCYHTVFGCCVPQLAVWWSLVLPHDLLYVLSQTFFCCLMPFDAVLSCPLQFLQCLMLFCGSLVLLCAASSCLMLFDHISFCSMLSSALLRCPVFFFFLLNLTLFPVNVFMFGAVWHLRLGLGTKWDESTTWSQDQHTVYSVYSIHPPQVHQILILSLHTGIF